MPGEATTEAALPAEPGARLRLAEERRRAGDDAGAEAAYRGVLALQPMQPAAMLGLAQVTQRLRGAEAAVRMLRMAVLAHPGHAGVRLELAEALRAAGREEEAVREYGRVADTPGPHVARALLGLARLARARATGPAALDLLRAALACNPDSLGLRLEVAQELVRLGRIEEAEAAWRAVLDLSPHHVGGLLALGQAARLRGERELALAQFQAAVAANPAHAGAKLELAHELRDQGRAEEAVPLYHEVLSAGPALGVAAWMGLGQLARRRGDRAAAERAFGAAAAAGTGAAMLAARTELAHLRRDSGRLDEAEDEYRTVLAACGEAPRQAMAVLLGLAQLERLRGDRAAALLCVEQALGAALRDPSASITTAALELAAELRDRGAHAEAARILQGVLAADPHHLPALLAHGLLHRARGDRAAALGAFEEAARRHPRHAQPLVEAALEHRALGDPAAASAALTGALARDPAHLGARLQRSDLLWMAEEAEASLALCRQMAAERPDVLQPRLDAARALAQLGRLGEALATLDAAATDLGPQAAIALRQGELLTQSGELRAAADALQRAVDEAPHHLGLRVRRAQAALALGEFAAVEATLADRAACPPQTTGEHAALALLRGQLADARWQPETALAAYAEVLRLEPLHAGAMAEAARAKLLLMDHEGSWRMLEASLRASASSLLLRGATARASQHHLGQILDEFRLDPAGVARLAALTARPAAARIGPLLEGIRAMPGSTPAAIALLLALRHSGALDRAAPPGACAIPCRIGQYWDAAEVPGDVAALMATWPRAHAGWTHAVFDDAAALRLLEDGVARRAFAEAVPEAYARAAMPAQKADLFRLAFLLARGGWWLDADDRCVGRLDALAPAGAELVLYQEEYATLGNNMIGAVPGHPVIRRALELAAEAVNRGDSDVVWLSTGPGLLSRAFAEALAEEGGVEAPWFARVAVVERGALARQVARHCRVAYKATDRHWLRAMAGGRRVKLAA